MLCQCNLVCLKLERAVIMNWVNMRNQMQLENVNLIHTQTEPIGLGKW